MSFETLDLSVDGGGVAHVRLNRPEKRNALSARMIDELSQLALTVGADPAIRAMVLSGAGETFCAGGDLDWMKSQIEADRTTRMAGARKLAEMLRALNEMPTPLIGRIHGGAFGGGVGLIAVCDVALAAKGTRFGFTETRLGLIPATIGPYVVARMGEGMARRVFMSSRRFDGAEAIGLGLIKAVHEEDELDAAVEAEFRPYASVAPGAVGAAKAYVRSLGPAITDAVIDASISRLADIWEGEEAAEGIAAFLERRPPGWAGEPD